MNNIETFTASYLAALIWSSTDDEGEPLDSGEYELSECATAACKADCLAFIAQAADLLNSTETPYSYSDAGHDFALTRNHHGAGFWGRGLGEVGDQLTTLCDQFGHADAYVGDDGLIYIMGKERAE